LGRALLQLSCVAIHLDDQLAKARVCAALVMSDSIARVMYNVAAARLHLYIVQLAHLGGR
jgi:hypothetical protein